LFGIPFGWNDRFCAALNDQIDEFLRVIPAVSDHVLKAEML